MGRSLANNITNLLLDPVWSQLCKKHKIDPLEIIEQEPDAGLGNGGLGRLAACFLDSMATLGIPGMGSGLRYEYGIFKQTVRDGWQHEQPDHWLARPDPWEVARPDEAVEVRLACSFEIHAGALRIVQGRPSTLIGIPYDRPVVGYGGKTINTLRLWSAATPDYFDFQQFSGGDFVGALAETLTAETLTRVLYPDDSTTRRQGAALPAAVLPRGLHAGRRDPPFPRCRQRLVRAARQSRDAAQRHAPDARGPRADAHPARRGEARVGRGLGPHAAHARLHEPHAAAGSAGEVAAAVVRDAAAAAARDHLRNQPPLPRRRARAFPRR